MRTTIEGLTQESLGIKNLLAVISLSAMCLLTAYAQNRITIPANINGWPVHVAFDSAAPHSALFRSAAVRLGLKIDAPSSPVELRRGGAQPAGWTLAHFVIGTSMYSARCAILDSAIPVDVDGALAWDDLRSSILEVVADRNQAIFLERLPGKTTQWPHWKLVARSDEDLSSRWLGFELPRSDGKRSAVLIDTGTDAGVYLSSARFKKWVEANSNAPVTIDAEYSPVTSDGLVVRDEYWATSLNLAEGLRLSNVPVRECSPSDNAREGFEATLGLFALTRLKVIVDGVGNMIYLKSVPEPTAAYTYNRLGAVFIPRDLKGGDLIARVARGGPAYRAGLRDGDILLKIGDLDATKWQTDSRILPLNRFWAQPSLTKLFLSCRRAGKTLDVTAELKEIFPQAVSPGTPSKD